MRKDKGKLWILLGLLLIVAALFLSAYNLCDELRARQSAMKAVDQLEDYLTSDIESDTSAEHTGERESPVRDEETVIPDYILSPNMEMPVKTINGIDYIGVLRIPALELELPVISQWSYPNLKIAPCRYSGSAYLDDLVLCAHNYNSHFGNLKTLQTGDTVIFTDMDGNEFRYEVVEVETLPPSAIEEMESGDWDLTLFTCTIGGRTRVTVRCERREQEAEEQQFNAEFRRALVKLEKLLHLTEDPSVITMESLKTVCAFYNADWAGILILDRTAEMWWPAVWYESGTGEMAPTLFHEVEYFENFPSWVESIETGNPIIIQDINEDGVLPEEAAQYRHLATRGMIGAPFGDRPTGFLVVRNPKRYPGIPDFAQMLAFVTLSSYYLQELQRN